MSKIYCKICICKFGRVFQNVFVLLQPPEAPEEQEEYKEYIPEDIYIYKPPVSKPWVSLGSEKEIEEESVKESTKQVSGLNMISSPHLSVTQQRLLLRDPLTPEGSAWLAVFPTGIWLSF